MLVTQALSILLTILVPGLLFIVALKRGWFVTLRTPIDRGVLFGGAPLFGPTKTWLGVLFYTVGGAVVAGLLSIPAAVGLIAVGLAAADGIVAPMFAAPTAVLAGAAIGLSYSAAELINSFVKRRIGIAPSARTSRGRGWIALQRFVDLTDGILAVVVLLLFWRVDPLLILVTAALGLGVHALTDILMHRLALKRH